MSASLVGSEMCIRDSFWQFHEQGASGRGSPCDRLGCRVGLPGYFAPPVSYTHLTLPTICSV
eukprot:14942629-Alexandrium_andersonii.AAC.1